MELAWVACIIALIVGVAIVRRYKRTHRAETHARAVAALQQIDSSSADPTDGERRAKRIAGRTPAQQVGLEFIPSNGRDEGTNTYWAAYEMIVRGFQVTLDMQEISQPSGGGGTYAIPSLPTVVSRMTYTTEAFIPHLRAIDSLETFGRYAPYRSDRTLKVSVHPDDLTDAYALLRDLGIRLSVMHHPDQHWWKDETL
jgi:hypothetical protein